MTASPQIDAIPLDGLAEQLDEHDLPLGVFSDEELVALGQPLHPQGPTGWFATLDAVARKIATQAALRGLVARGLLRSGSQPGTLEAHPALDLLRACRLHAQMVTLVSRTSGETSVDRALIHLVAPGILLEEVIDPDGLHACTLRSPVRTANTLALRVDPEQVAGNRAGTAIGGEDPSPTVLARLEQLRDAAVWRTELATLRRDERSSDAPDGEAGLRSVHVLALADELWAVTRRPVRGDAREVAIASPLSAPELPVFLRSIIDPTISPESAAQEDQPDGRST